MVNHWGKLLAPIGREQVAAFCPVVYGIDPLLPIKNYPAQNVNSAKVEKP